ncbi:MAG: N-6 DNA methylase [Chloroflexi bacterium]|nr:N-6 DNA methylase [Chloroflexota bacterium]MYC01196.1 N-6 DNA methylase [Chloroflexota bacterium]
MTTATSFNEKIWTICDIMRRSNYSGAMGYIADLTWLLFLRLLDESERLEAERLDALGIPFDYSLPMRFRWSNWAAPEGQIRTQLQSAPGDSMVDFVDRELLPHLRGLDSQAGASERQRTISQIVSGVSGIGMDGNKNLLDVLDLLDDVHADRSDSAGIFALSQAYEGLLLEMGQTNRDAGQFFTPRLVVRAMVEAVAPQLGETVYDPCCGTGGFLAQAYDHMRSALGDRITGPELNQLGTSTFYGREKADLVYAIALGNLVVHGIEQPNIWHGNTLTRMETYGGLYVDAPEMFDVVLTNPPFGGREGDDAQQRFDIRSRETQLLFLQEVIGSLKDGGRAAMVIDEGTLFKDTHAHRQVRQKLLDECDLYCIVSLATGAFTDASTGVKTDLLFFTKGGPTERIWYYEISPPAEAERAGGSGNQRTFNKGYPLTSEHFKEFLELLPSRADSERSWSVWVDEIAEPDYDLKAVNPNRPDITDTRSPSELLEEIDRHGRDLESALADLRQALRSPVQ